MDRAEAFIEQSKEIALVMARLAAFARGRGFVLQRNRSGMADATLQEASERFARDKTQFRWGVDVQAFQAARKHDVRQWWTWRLIDVEPVAGADHVCFESAEVVRELVDTQFLEAVDDRASTRSRKQAPEFAARAALHLTSQVGCGGCCAAIQRAVGRDDRRTA